MPLAIFSPFALTYIIHNTFIAIVTCCRSEPKFGLVIGGCIYQRATLLVFCIKKKTVKGKRDKSQACQQIGLEKEVERNVMPHSDRRSLWRLIAIDAAAAYIVNTHPGLHSVFAFRFV